MRTNAELATDSFQAARPTGGDRSMWSTSTPISHAVVARFMVMEFWTTVAQIIPVLFLAVAIETRGSHRRSRSEAAKALFVAVLSLGMLMELFALSLIHI